MALRRWLLGTLILLVAGGTILFGAFLALPAVRDYIYREGSYQVVLERVSRGVSDPLVIAERLSQYVHQQMYPGGGLTIDADPWSQLVRGLGWCDQKAWVAGTLMSVRGIPSRVIQFYSKEGNPVHATLEVAANEEWLYHDLLFGFVLRQPGGSRASRQELLDHPGMLSAQPAMRLLDPAAQEHIHFTYQRIFDSDKEPSIIMNVLKNRSGGAKGILSQGIHRFWAAFGSAWSHGFQDLYLALLPEHQETFDREWDDPSANLNQEQIRQPLYWYTKGRHYQLYGRLEKALEHYHKVMGRYPESYVAEWSQMWAGIAEFERGHLEAASELLLQYVAHSPKTDHWKGRACDWLAQIYARSGNAERARHFEQLALRDPHSAAAMRLAEQRFALSE